MLTMRKKISCSWSEKSVENLPLSEAHVHDKRNHLFVRKLRLFKSWNMVKNSEL